MNLGLISFNSKPNTVDPSRVNFGNRLKLQCRLKVETKNSWSENAISSENGQVFWSNYVSIPQAIKNDKKNKIIIRRVEDRTCSARRARTKNLSKERKLLFNHVCVRTKCWHSENGVTVFFCKHWTNWTFTTSLKRKNSLRKDEKLKLWICINNIQ